MDVEISATEAGGLDPALPALGNDFDDSEILPEDSSFIAALSVLTDSFTSTGSEQGWILVSDELAGPALLTTMIAVQERMADDDHVARVSDISPDGTTITRAVLSSPVTLLQGVVAADPLNYTDADRDGIPDIREEVLAIYALLESDPWTSNELHDHVLGADGEFSEGLIRVELLDVAGDRGALAWNELKVDIEPFESAGHDTVITGPPLMRSVIFEVIPEIMLQSLGLALVIVLLILMVLFRSWKEGLVTGLAVVMVFSWLIGTMYIVGFALNIVTVFIAGMSIGVGIDFSIHITQRYREEKMVGKRPEEAMSQALGETGTALLAPTLTTVLGFGVLYLSPVRSPSSDC